MSKTFTVTDEQEAKIKAWMETQPKPHWRGGGDGGWSVLEYIFASNNVGDILYVRNALNGDSLDLTDYGSW